MRHARSTKIRGLRNMTVELNGPYIGAWPELIGKFIINFGGIELASLQYLELLEPTRNSFNRQLGKPLETRIDRILTIVRDISGIHPQLRTQIVELWEEVKDGAKLRNLIAHNPVIPGWRPGSDPSKDRPDYVEIPAMRQLRNGEKISSMPFELLREVNDHTVSVALRLFGAFERLRMAVEG